jgi:hypothetical protein
LEATAISANEQAAHFGVEPFRLYNRMAPMQWRPELPQIAGQFALKKVKSNAPIGALRKCRLALALHAKLATGF